MNNYEQFCNLLYPVSKMDKKMIHKMKSLGTQHLTSKNAYCYAFTFEGENRKAGQASPRNAGIIGSPPIKETELAKIPKSIS